MLKVIFVTLLTLTACLSIPVENSSNGAVKSQENSTLTAANPPQAPGIQTPDQGKVNSTKNETTPDTSVTLPTNATQGTTNNNNSSSKGEQAGQNVVGQAEKNITPAPVATAPDAAGVNNNQTKDQIDNKKTNQSEPQTSTEKAKGPTEQITNKTIPPSSPKAVTEKTKAAEVTTPDKAAEGRRFDGPSFIGGMILTLGLLAVGLLGFKYYKTQRDRNYHTL